MSVLRGRKLNIHDYYKESLETQNNNKENVAPNKTLVGRRILKTPIIIDEEGEEFVPLTQSDQIVKSHSSSEVGRRSSSFELLLKSFFTLNKTPLNNKNRDDASDLSFEELMNKILTPDLHNLKPNSHDVARKVGDSREITAQTSHKNDSSFEELTNIMVTPNLPNLRINSSDIPMETTNKITTQRPTLTNKVSETLHKSSASLIDLTNTTGTGTPDSPDLRADNLDNFDQAQATIAEETDKTDLSFEKLMKEMLTPDLANLEGNTRDTTQIVSANEISTQTSFDNLPVKCFFTPIPSPNLTDNNLDLPSPLHIVDINNSETVNSIKLENVEINTNTCAKVEEGHTGQKRTNIKEKTAVGRRKLRERNIVENEQNVEVNTNILNILSQDITMPSSKIKFNNIGKIGTNQWLQFALEIVGKRTSKNNRKRKLSVEVYNNNDINPTNAAVQHIKRYRRGNTKISKINNIDDSDNVTPVSQQYDSNTSTCLNEVEQKLRLGIDKILTNKDLVPGDVSTITQVDKNKMKTTINDLLVKVYAAFESERVPLLMCRKRDYKSCVFKDGRLQLKPFKEAPHKKSHPCKKYVYMLYILGKAYSLLESDSTLTKRELFYQVKPLLTRPEMLYVALDEVCCLLNVGRWHLNIIAHSGLVYGDLKLTWSSGETTYCNTPVSMIPFNSDDIVEVQTTACFILVVEKESIFHKLLQEDLPNKLALPFIMITGKGVPDFSTLQFLKKISIMMALPVFILVDADIYGIKIMLNYRFGTATNSYLSEYLAVPNAQWLGVFPSEISKFGISHLEMKKSEKTIAKNVLKYPFMESHPIIMQEVELLLKNNKKASIEGLIKNNTFLSESYLPTKFFNQDFI